MTKGRIVRLWIGVAITAVAVVFGITWPSVRHHLQALAVLKTLSHEPLLWPARMVTVRDVAVEEVVVAGGMKGRLYTPVGVRDAPGMVIVHGVHHLGMNEPRLVTFAKAMASCGLQVLTPELPAIADYRIGPESVTAISDSVNWFAAKTGGKVGLLGLSFAGGLALMAAERDSSRMTMVFAVGSQANMQRVARYYRTGKDVRPDGTVQVLPAHEYGPLVLEYEHMEDFTDAVNVNPLGMVLKEHLYEDGVGERKALEALSAVQHASAMQMLNAADPHTVALLEVNEKKHAADMDAVSPDRDLWKVNVPVYLLHGEADNVIPAAETLWLAKGVRPEVLKGALVSPLISHVEMGKSPGFGDEWRLLDFMAGVMRTAGAR